MKLLLTNFAVVRRPSGFSSFIQSVRGMRDLHKHVPTAVPCQEKRQTSRREFLFFFYIINNRSLSLLLPSSVAPGRPARRQKRSEDDWNASSPYHHLPLRPSKSLNYSRNRSNSSDSINDLAESLVATTDDAAIESSPTSPYSDHLRSSSYALLRPTGQPQQQKTA